jgi:hypothetical protein
VGHVGPERRAAPSDEPVDACVRPQRNARRLVALAKPASASQTTALYNTSRIIASMMGPGSAAAAAMDRI